MEVNDICLLRKFGESRERSKGEARGAYLQVLSDAVTDVIVEAGCLVVDMAAERKHLNISATQTTAMRQLKDKLFNTSMRV